MIMEMKENKPNSNVKANPNILTLQNRLEAYYEKPIDEIFVESIQEVDTGSPKGNEIW